MACFDKEHIGQLLGGRGDNLLHLTIELLRGQAVALCETNQLQINCSDRKLLARTAADTYCNKPDNSLSYPISINASVLRLGIHFWLMSFTMLQCAVCLWPRYVLVLQGM